MKKHLKKEYILYTIVLLLFICLTTIISLKHEYWSDEAQAWLIAKDASIKEIICNISREEGHPILYFIVLKFFQILGLKYTNFRIISLLFSSIGVYLLLFKSKIKWYIKTLLPFTFFIFYQYTVISRSYSLILPLILLLTIIWEKRKNYYPLFTLILILLINLEPHTFLLAGSIYFLELIDFFKNDIHNKKRIPYLIIIFLSFLITTIYIFPTNTNNLMKIHLLESSLSGGLFTSTNNSTVERIASIIIFTYFVIIYLTKKTKIECYQALLFFIPIYLFNTFIYSARWHEGLYFILLIFLLCIHKLDEIKSFKILLLFTAFIQIFWSIKTSIYDFNNKYSSSYEVSEFIKKYDYQNYKIYANYFFNVELNPYFDKNIYTNWYHDKRFFTFDKNNTIAAKTMTIEDLLEYDGDMYIIIQYDSLDDYKSLYVDNYNEYIFHERPYYKDKLNNTTKREVTILIKKELDVTI